jgi:predicted histone-like DNA-binding protein
MNTRRLSNHIAEHGSIYTPDVVYGVMEKFRSCLLEMLLESKRVKIEGLGTFYATIECSKGGAVNKDKFNVQKNIEGLHIRFLPEQEQETNISSRQFLKQAEFVNIDSLLKKEETEGDDENTNGGGSGNGSDSQNSGSDNSGSGSQNTGSITGNDSGSQSGNDEPGNYRVNITKYGSGTMSVTDDSEQEINSGDSVASGSNVNISVVPVAGKVPTAKVNGIPINLTENNGTYTGSFVMPMKSTEIEINSDPSEHDFGDDI